jgi:hypothetical protein
MRATSFLLFLLSVAFLTFVAGAAIVAFLRWRDSWQERQLKNPQPPDWFAELGNRGRP